MPAKMQHSGSIHAAAAAVLWVVTVIFYSPLLFAQHGHPLAGTWSGEKMTDGASPVRVLLVLEFSADQVISGYIIENARRRVPLEATLDPDTWTVSLVGHPAGGGDYRIQGGIENLGSATERTIAGTWREGEESGDFRVTLN